MSETRKRSPKVEAAYAMIRSLCKPRYEEGHRDWIMSIPADPERDPDLVISAGLRDLESKLETDEKDWKGLLTENYEQEVAIQRLTVLLRQLQTCPWCTTCKEDIDAALTQPAAKEEK